MKYKINYEGCSKMSRTELIKEFKLRARQQGVMVMNCRMLSPKTSRLVYFNCDVLSCCAGKFEMCTVEVKQDKFVISDSGVHIANIFRDDRGGNHA